MYYIKLKYSGFVFGKFISLSKNEKYFTNFFFKTCKKNFKPANFRVFIKRFIHKFVFTFFVKCFIFICIYFFLLNYLYFCNFFL